MTTRHCKTGIALKHPEGGVLEQLDIHLQYGFFTHRELDCEVEVRINLVPRVYCRHLESGVDPGNEVG